ncbi:MAG: 3-phosphoshikimate 1-carboxyvinyltransferase [Bacteroidota bacterium]|nr:3-phosphoshikimate 1-carboxyvinyltransferase [Bacteroidota bacterium]
MPVSLHAPATLQGSIGLPASKSISNRALILNALAGEGFTLDNLADCDDTHVMVKALNSMGETIDIGAAGTSMRFLTAFLTLQHGKRELTGSERMKNRPIGVLVDALRRLGATIDYAGKEGFPPLIITGKPMAGGEIDLDGSISSQYLSALMMVGPCLQQGLTLHIKGTLISKPYAEMTVKMMSLYGVSIDWKDTIIHIPPQHYQAISFRVESDWSAASYWYELLCLAPEGAVQLKGLSSDSLQGDSRIASLFEPLGVHTDFTPEGVTLTKTAVQASFFQADLTDQPDLAQTLVLTCLLKSRPFRLTGLQTLRIKETDRIHALMAESEKLGYLIKETSPGTLEWQGERCATVPGIEIETYDDHRMAMAFAPAAFIRDGLIIRHPEVVSKSYPGFWHDLQTAGFTIAQ